MTNSFDPRRNQPRQNFDQSAWRFGVQVAFSAVVLGLCIFQLVSKPSNDQNTALYWGGVTSVLAYWLPSPGQNRDDKEQMTINTRTFTATDSNGQVGNDTILAQTNSTTITTDSKN
ncbi:hypothetical protein H6G80_32175 [Nostoc sp. FACHB-87]|uniref:hypothetical protein n=1 Tax=Nostocales TaxID=1161 RepID=UPI0016876694|nr:MULTISPECIES: hypothetical protein [Nostocales]MBD2301326.1 hypothetical protein [Nostoc sp. FACHB-190]MBD2458707.1 hypothetical protein [Nostoc sp. FACHB-87]MBD2478175.1 hypothetical protein [Anabaena sp. FACHB-83]MBD2486795.1 hypothetical protein [Aulosira sp. FACHB-615]